MTQRDQAAVRRALELGVPVAEILTYLCDQVQQRAAAAKAGKGAGTVALSVGLGRDGRPKRVDVDIREPIWEARDIGRLDTLA